MSVTSLDMKPTFVVFESLSSFPFLLLLICLLGCLISLGTGSLEAQNDVETKLVFSDVGTITPGQTFNLDLMIEGKFNLAGWETGIFFNSGILELVSVEEGDLLKNAFFQPGAIDNDAGSITGLAKLKLRSPRPEIQMSLPIQPKRQTTTPRQRNQNHQQRNWRLKVRRG